MRNTEKQRETENIEWMWCHSKHFLTHFHWKLASNEAKNHFTIRNYERRPRRRRRRTKNSSEIAHNVTLSQSLSASTKKKYEVWFFIFSSSLLSNAWVAHTKLLRRLHLTWIKNGGRRKDEKKWKKDQSIMWLTELM